MGTRVTVADEFGERPAFRINFSSQDYLALGQCQELRDAAREAIDHYGIHSAGSPVLCGRTSALLALERRLADVVSKDECLVYPTGWAAGFGVLAGLVRPDDTVVLDRLSHNCLQEGACHGTRNVRKFAHNDLDDLGEVLRQERKRDREGGLFVVLESLYSMDSDSPDLPAAIALARAYDAIVILDIAHDFGALGRHGLGLLESASADPPDVIMGSFSKTFAANGGFVACSSAVRQYLIAYSSPHIFSNAISPIQTAIVARAVEIVFSDDGVALRTALLDRIGRIRGAMREHGLQVAGIASPIVPVFVGDEKSARLTSRHLAENGLLANLVEFPAVARGSARFRFQVMANHDDESIDSAAKIMAHSRSQAEAELGVLR